MRLILVALSDLTFHFVIVSYSIKVALVYFIFSSGHKFLPFLLKPHLVIQVENRSGCLHGSICIQRIGAILLHDYHFVLVATSESLQIDYIFPNWLKLLNVLIRVMRHPLVWLRTLLYDCLITKKSRVKFCHVKPLVEFRMTVVVILLIGLNCHLRGRLIELAALVKSFYGR